MPNMGFKDKKKSHIRQDRVLRVYRNVGWRTLNCWIILGPMKLIMTKIFPFFVLKITENGSNTFTCAKDVTWQDISWTYLELFFRKFRIKMLVLWVLNVRKTQNDRKWQRAVQVINNLESYGIGYRRLRLKQIFGSAFGWLVVLVRGGSILASGILSLYCDWQEESIVRDFSGSFRA